MRGISPEAANSISQSSEAVATEMTAPVWQGGGTLGASVPFSRPVLQAFNNSDEWGLGTGDDLVPPVPGGGSCIEGSELAFLNGRERALKQVGLSDNEPSAQGYSFHCRSEEDDLHRRQGSGHEDWILSAGSKKSHQIPDLTCSCSLSV